MHSSPYQPHSTWARKPSSLLNEAHPQESMNIRLKEQVNKMMFQMSFKEAASGRGGDDERKGERRQACQLSKKVPSTCHTPAPGFSLWWFLPPSPSPSVALSCINPRDITLEIKGAKRECFSESNQSPWPDDSTWKLSLTTL